MSVTHHAPTALHRFLARQDKARLIILRAETQREINATQHRLRELEYELAQIEYELAQIERLVAASPVVPPETGEEQ